MELRKQQEWLYRASPAREDRERTTAIVRDFGFICRNPFADAAKKQWIANVQKVDFRHIIHLYFIDGDGGAAIGSFRVIAPKNHPRLAHFASAVEGAPALRTVAQGDLAEFLRMGYTPDPRLGVFCGWPVVLAETSGPAYDPGLFPGQNALFEYPSLAPSRRR